METKVKERTIDLHKIQEGIHTFTAKVKEIRLGEEWLDAAKGGKTYEYVYFKDISILLKGEWYKVECSGNPFRAKLEGELAELNLQPDDIVHFNAEAIDDLIEFLFVEGYTDRHLIHFFETCGDVNAIAHDEPFAILPKSYQGNIAIGYCEAVFLDSVDEDKVYNISMQIPRYQFDLEYPKIINALGISAQNDPLEKRLSMFFYKPLFNRFFNCSKLPVQEN